MTTCKRRVQCAKCPWRKDVDPRDIPNGYSQKKHAGLRDTIAEPGALPGPVGALKVMACHETPIGKELVCVGWLANQLGPGNNIALRLAARRRPDLTNYELVGEQHERFEDTGGTKARQKIAPSDNRYGRCDPLSQVRCGGETNCRSRSEGGSIMRVWRK